MGARFEDGKIKLSWNQDTRECLTAALPLVIEWVDSLPPPSSEICPLTHPLDSQEDFEAHLCASFADKLEAIRREYLQKLLTTSENPERHCAMVSPEFILPMLDESAQWYRKMGSDSAAETIEEIAIYVREVQACIGGDSVDS